MFPASTTPLAASSTPYPARQVLAEGKGFSVLVVEDQASMRAALVSELRRARVSDIFEAPDGGAALHLFKARRPELVLLDIKRRGKDDDWAAQQMRVSESSDWTPDRLTLRHSQRAGGVARDDPARRPGPVRRQGAGPEPVLRF